MRENLRYEKIRRMKRIEGLGEVCGFEEIWGTRFGDSTKCRLKVTVHVVVFLALLSFTSKLMHLEE